MFFIQIHKDVSLLDQESLEFVPRLASERLAGVAHDYIRTCTILFVQVYVCTHIIIRIICYIIYDEIEALNVRPHAT